VNRTQQANRRGDAIGMLVSTMSVRLIDVSRGGCRVEVARHLETGSSGQLQVTTDGVLHVDDVRVCRCRMREGSSRVHHAAVELLGTRRLSRRSLRLAIRRITGEYLGHMTEQMSGSARRERDDECRTRGKKDERETHGKKGGCRAPPLPATVDTKGLVR
jgi:hypothetical protein